MYTSYPLPADEEERLRVLQEYEILDTLQEQSYDDIVLLAAQLCEVPTALVSFIDRDRQWFKARLGFDRSETPREQSFCAHAIVGRGLFHVHDATGDPRFRTNPLVVREPSIRFYAGMPLVCPQGHALGTLCVIDSKPRELKEEQAKALEALGRQVVAQLELARQRKQLEKLLEEQAKAALAMAGLNTILQNSVEGIARLDAEGTIVSVNARYAASYGYAPEQMIGMPVQATVHGEHQPRLDGALQTMRKYGRAETELTGLRKNGASFYKHCVLVSVKDADGVYSGSYCFLRDITQSKVLEKRLARGAYHDSLTDLPNRLAFVDTLVLALNRFRRRENYHFAVLYIDLDGFKLINDTYGNAAGDHVLQTVAQRLQQCLRPGDVASRLGGDEFAVLLDDIADVADYSHVADRVLMALSLPMEWGNHLVTVGASIGVSVSHPRHTEADAILAEADAAMYRVKQAGKGGVSLFDPDYNSEADTRA